MKMLNMYHGGNPLELAKAAGCLTSFQNNNNVTLFPIFGYSSWKCSKPRNYKAQNLGCGILFLEKGGRKQMRTRSSEIEFEVLDDEGELDGPQKRFRERGEEKDYDRDPEFAEILGSCLDDPDTAKSKMEERLRKKKNKVLQEKTGSGSPMKVTFNKFEYSNSYIWFEFYNPPLQKDLSLICDVIRSWHIIGRLGGCNSLNMQLSQSPLDKRPSYDAIQGANVDPTTFYNIGDLEIQDNVARYGLILGRVNHCFWMFY